MVRKQEGISEFEINKDILVIHVNGELDHHNSAFIREQADDIIYHNNIHNIIFDFAGTAFMDSSGIGVIMGRYKLIKGVGGKIGIINAGNSIRKILLYYGLNKITMQYSDLDSAVETISNERGAEEC